VSIWGQIKIQEASAPGATPNPNEILLLPQLRPTEARAVQKNANRYQHITSARAVKNQAKNNVTSRVRLDEKYAERRALAILANQKPQSARVFGVFLQRDARLESSSPAVPLA
jgi:hypothetical protein